MEPGEIVLADRGFCGWGLIALFQRKGVGVVMRLHQARTEQLGRQVWLRPQRPQAWDRALWRELPWELRVRLVRFNVEVSGFRTATVTRATTLLDAEKYPDAALAELYRRRRLVEGGLRDLKTTLSLDV